MTDPQLLREAKRIGVRFNTSAGYAPEFGMLALDQVGGVELLGEIARGAGGITLIDLDSCAASDPLLDPALLIARLHALPFILGPAAPAVPNLDELPAVFEAT